MFNIYTTHVAPLDDAYITSMLTQRIFSSGLTYITITFRMHLITYFNSGCCERHTHGQIYSHYSYINMITPQDVLFMQHKILSN